MTFSDIFKSSFLEDVGSVTMLDMALAMTLSFMLGVFIFFVYKKTFQGVMYSAGFGVTLIGLCMVTTLVILAVTSNVVLSLGMVGALSIVRFRTAIKEPLDIVFLFWSIAAGIVLAAGMIGLSVCGSFLIGLVLLVFVNRKTVTIPYVMVLRCTDRAVEKMAVSFLRSHVKKCVLKGKTVRSGETELNFEVRLKNDDTDFVSELAEMDGVYSAVLVSYNGDYMS
ncbi:MAG: DUF4956 domain-containing protein [Ruminococcaceae bacterium]|nr:DUF4956 domain-containing protein [Oscillospiraceae bacterium]